MSVLAQHLVESVGRGDRRPHNRQNPRTISRANNSEEEADVWAGESNCEAVGYRRGTELAVVTGSNDSERSRFDRTFPASHQETTIRPRGDIVYPQVFIRAPNNQIPTKVRSNLLSF